MKMENQYTNPRKNKKLYSLWLTELEEKLLLQEIKASGAIMVKQIIRQAFDRGDLEKR